MQVVILAGGRGTRLHPYTVTLPKPLVPVGDRPILEILLRQLKTAGAEEIILSTGHLAQLIEAYFGDGSRWGLRLRYARESVPLNTAGPLAMIEGLREDFLVMNGDVLTSMDFREFWKRHLSSRAAATIAVCRRSVAVEFGVVEMDDQSRLAKYSEKPQLAYNVSMGVNALNRRCLKFIKRGEPLSMPDLLIKIKESGDAVNCFVSTDDWLDIGRPEDYQLAQEKIKADRKAYFPDEP